MFKVALVVAALLGALDVVSAFAAGTAPLFILILTGILGLLTILGAFYVRTHLKAGLWTVVITRAISALSAVPVLFGVNDDITGGVKVGVAIILAITIIDIVVLFLTRPRRVVS